MIRDKDTAERVAKARMELLSKSTVSVAKILGNAKIMLGDTVKVEGLKETSMNGEFQVRSVEHILSKDKGFISLIGWRF